MKHILGISAGFHDAAVAVVREDGEIVFAGHSERYSKIKNDPNLHPDLLKEIHSYEIDSVAFYERPWMHNYQQWRSGQKQYGPWTLDGALQKYLGDYYVDLLSKKCSPVPSDFPIFSLKRNCYQHHLSHAAAGFQTSSFQEAAVVVIDAVGEMDTISIWHAYYDSRGKAHYECRWKQYYPHSIGLFYSAVTQAVGLKPMEEEYITMGMAAYGSDLGAAYLMDQVVTDPEEIKFYKNLHIGFDEDETKSIGNENFAAAAQGVTETLIMNVMRRACRLVNSKNLVYMGGVALNCVANSRLGQLYDKIWIMPNPGDAGSSLGAAALSHGGQLRWRDAFLGHLIPGPYPVRDILDRLITHRIVGVASGRAEWGPRALGNRSLLADPRGPEIKDQVNEIKRRQKFRPFAPVVLEEYAKDIFDMPLGFESNPYMQCVAVCNEPDRYPAIVHADNTSRVQTVPPDGSGIRRLLEEWFVLTGCPMLLNTSLNIRGEPMVNDRADADRFEQKYGVKVCS